MKNFPSLLFFQFYRYSDELIEQSELERVFTMSTTKGATQDLTFTTATNVTGSTFCTGRIVRFPRRQDPQTLIQQGGICCPFAENFSLTVKLPLSPMNSTQFRSSRTFRQKQIPGSHLLHRLRRGTVKLPGYVIPLRVGINAEFDGFVGFG